MSVLDEPSKPKAVELTDWDKDHADLKWQKPDSDGGAPITGYVIEYKVRKMTDLIIFQIHITYFEFNYSFLFSRRNSAKTG